MKRLVFCSGLLASAMALAVEAILPEAVALMPGGEAVAVAERGGCQVSVRDLQGKELKAFAATKREGGFLGLFATEVPLPVTGVAVAADGTLFWTAENGNEGLLMREDGERVVTGNRPMSPVLSPDGKFLYLCNRFDATVQKYDAKSLKLLAETKAVREAHGCALGKDGKLLFVINLLPDDATEPVKWTAARVTVIEIGRAHV